jgi:ankyrin repeat protein
MRQLLIERCPNCVTEASNGKKYKGETVLHLAVMQQQVALVDYLVKEANKLSKLETLLCARATGDFFTGKSDEGIDYGGSALSIAVCTQQPALVDYLVHNGADLAEEDSNGNTLLHLCVEHGLRNMYASTPLQFHSKILCLRTHRFIGLPPVEHQAFCYCVLL